MQTPDSIAPKLLLHMESKSEYYAVTYSELHQLAAGEQSHWKDLSIATGTVFVPTAVNTIVELAQETGFNPSVGVFLNAVLALVSLTLCLVSGFVWRRTRKNIQALLKAICSRPPHPLALRELDPRASSTGIYPEGEKKEFDVVIDPVGTPMIACEVGVSA